ncbi:hypothetical protein Trydic_g9912 [Trypoxylus dichotomus]
MKGDTLRLSLDNMSESDVQGGAGGGGSGVGGPRNGYSNPALDTSSESMLDSEIRGSEAFMGKFQFLRWLPVV